MILRNGKLTTWTDEIPNLILAAHDAAFGRMQNDVVELVSERHNISLTVSDGIAETQDRPVMEAALAQGYWIREVFDGWEILLNWSKDPANRPDNHAIHA